MSCDVGEVTERLENEQGKWWKDWRMSRAHSPTLLLLHLCHSSFSNPSFTSPMSQALHLIHSAHSPTFPSHHLRHNSFSNPSVASPTSQFILESFYRFSYVTSSLLNSPGELWSFSNPSVALPTSQLILQPFSCFTYVTVHSPIPLSLLLRHKLLTWWAAHAHQTYS